MSGCTFKEMNHLANIRTGKPLDSHSSKDPRSLGKHSETSIVSLLWRHISGLNGRYVEIIFNTTVQWLDCTRSFIIIIDTGDFVTAKGEINKIGTRWGSAKQLSCLRRFSQRCTFPGEVSLKFSSLEFVIETWTGFFRDLVRNTRWCGTPA